MRYSFRYLLKSISLVLISVLTAYAQGTYTKKIMVDIDFMEGFTFQKPASQIILGNPIIADITVRDEQSIFISGKSPGRTHMLVYGHDGKISERYILVVRDPDIYLTVYQGAQNKAHFDCEPLCQRVLRIEDSASQAQDQSGKITAQIGLIEGRTSQVKAEEAAVDQQKSGR
jgi:Flp pilus assembly secretin CpaC